MTVRPLFDALIALSEAMSQAGVDPLPLLLVDRDNWNRIEATIATECADLPIASATVTRHRLVLSVAGLTIVHRFDNTHDAR